MAKKDALRIGILAPVWFAVPPTGYGGIEWVVLLLADGLAEAGHDVTLFASGDSRTNAKLSYVYEERSAQLSVVGSTSRSSTPCTARSQVNPASCTTRSRGQLPTWG